MFRYFHDLKMAVTKLLLFVASVWIISTAGHEFFSSTDKILQLVEQERILLDAFSSYITYEEQNLKRLKRNLQIFKLFSYSENPELTMSNPGAAYKLIRRLRSEWLSALDYAQKNSFEAFQQWLHSDSIKIPSEEDLDGAALGLITLQQIYQLYPDNITKGMLFTEDEAFHVGSVSYEQGKYQHAFHWFKYSLAMSRETESIHSKKLLLDYLGTSAYRFGDLPVANYFYLRLLSLDPTNELLKIKLDEIYRTFQNFKSTSYPDIYTLTAKSGDPYEALCRGEVDQRTSRRQRALSCSYSTGGGNPRLILAPVKEEVVWDEPRIIRYHDVITDKEIEILKSLSRPQLSRSGVNVAEGQDAVSDYRVSQSVFLSEDDIVVARVNQRIADFTGLSMETAESLHVQNYGISGRYEPHCDALDEKNDRIATFLIYMSDVEIGGATVFPKVGVALQPIKGSAVFWYNLLKNGDVDLNTQHAGCPVFVGNKWVANKWIHEFGQEFTRPCSLSEWE